MFSSNCLFQLEVDPVALAEVFQLNAGQPLELSNAGLVYLDQHGLRTNTNGTAKEDQEDRDCNH